MQLQRPSDPHLLCDMRVKTSSEAMGTPLRSLMTRSASARADPPSPFSSNPAHEPVTTPSTPAAAAASSFGCMAATPTDSPPATPKDVKPKAAPAVLSAAAFAAFWSPRRLMQRAARAFRSSRSRRRIKLEGRDEPVALVISRLSDAASAGSMDAEHGSSDGNNSAAAADGNKGTTTAEEEQPQQNIEDVPEKIIHVANHHHQEPPVVVKDAEEACEPDKTAEEKKENHNAAAKEEEEEEEPKKGAVTVLDAVVNNADMADKFCMVVKEAMVKKQEDEEDQAATGMKKEATRRFRVKARAELEQPPRRDEVRRSNNDVIEEACTKLLGKRQGSRVRALVGAFETVMDAKPAAGKPQHHHRKSVA